MPKLLKSIETADFSPRMKKCYFSVCKDTQEGGNEIYTWISYSQGAKLVYLAYCKKGVRRNGLFWNKSQKFVMKTFYDLWAFLSRI